MKGNEFTMVERPSIYFTYLLATNKFHATLSSTLNDLEL